MKIRYIALLLPLLLAACGYSFGEGEQSVLESKFRTLAIDEVNNPTTLTWLEPRIRKLLRDELTNRGSVAWTDDRARADALITIDIDRYSRSTDLEGEGDETVRSSATFSFSATIKSTLDDQIVWQSGLISQSWPFFSGQETEADEQVTLNGIRRLADRMSQNY